MDETDPKEPDKDESQLDLSKKRLSESEPHELEMAFKQALKDSGKIQPIGEEANSLQPETTILEPAQQEAHLQESLPETSKSIPEEVAGHVQLVGESDKNYENSFSLFADIFYGVLVAPKQTMLVLGDSKRFAPSPGHIAQAGFLAVLALSATGWLRFKVDHAADTAAGSLFFVLSGLGDWLFISLVLFYLSIFMRGHRLTPGNAFITVGWCFLPFFFFAPVACFKGLFGNGFIYFATIPAFWFLYLLWTAFEASLRTTAAKLALLLIAVPPLVVIVYVFWIGLSALLLLVQLAKCLSP